MIINEPFLDALMSEALAEARAAADVGEVPVGAVIAHQGSIIARGRNRMEESRSASSHAEILAIAEAGKALGNWRLAETVLCVTLEPCTMCLGAIRLARIPVVVFATEDAKMGAAGSIYDLTLDPRLGAPPRVIRGIRRDESVELLQSFFKKLRR